jgi:hypothetical protein
LDVESEDLGTLAKLIHVHVFVSQDYDTARAYAECALAMLDTHKMYESAKAATKLRVYGLVTHCYTPIEICMKGLLEGYNDGMAVGDSANAFRNILHYLELCFHLGKNLEVLDTDLEVYMEQMKVYNQWQQHSFAMIMRSVVVQKLMGVRAVDAPNDIRTDNRSRTVLLFKELFLSAWMRDDVYAANEAIKLKRELSHDDLHPGVNEVDFIEAMVAIVCFGAARKSSREKSKFLAQAWKARRTIQIKTRKGNPNFIHLGSLIEAELNAYRCRKDIAKLQYQTAISFSARKGQINIQALSSERYGDYMHEIGELEEASYRWKNALGLYSEWGALAKVDQVKYKLDNLEVVNGTKLNR